MTKNKSLKIAIASGKGGTGKTFVSTNLFYAAKEAGLKVCLVDCDAEEPNVCGFLQGNLNYILTASQKIPQIDTDKCTFCGNCSEYCAYHAITFLPYAKYIQVTPELCHSCGACLVACKFDAITETDLPIGVITSCLSSKNAELIECKINVGIERPSEIIRTAQKQVPFSNDLVIYDSPPGISCSFISTAENADIVILVAEPTPFGLNDLKLSVETLRKIKKPIVAIINKDGMGNNEVEKYLNNEKIQILAKIPFDTTIAQLCSNGQLLSKQNKEYCELFKDALTKIMIK